MPEKKPVYGIWIKEDETTKNTGSQLIFITEAGVFKPKHPKEWIFVTTPPAHRTIGQNQQLVGKQIGHIIVKVFHGKKTIMMYSFYPLGEGKGTENTIYFGEEFEKFEKKGMGRFVFATAVRMLQKKFPEHNFEVFIPNDKVKEMFRKMGIELRKTDEHVYELTGLNHSKALDHIALRMRQIRFEERKASGKHQPENAMHPNPQSERGKRLSRRH